ncbi:MAG: OmpA family protein [Marinifilaceae bacterium]
MVKKKNKSRSKLIAVLFICVILIIGVVLFLITEKKEINSYEEVQVVDSTTIVQEQKVSKVLKDKGVEFAKEINNVGESINDVESLRRSLKNDKIIPIIGALFEFDSSDINEKGLFLLKEYVDVYKKQNFSKKLLLEGYTCDKGAKKYNLDLSEIRVKVIKTELLKLGLDSESIISSAYGEERFKVVGDIEECRKLNRVVNISIK